jgi:hypothetical protein
MEDLGVDWMIILKWIFKNMMDEGWISLVQNKDQLRPLVNTVTDLLKLSTFLLGCNTLCTWEKLDFLAKHTTSIFMVEE